MNEAMSDVNDAALVTLSFTLTELGDFILYYYLFKLRELDSRV